MSLPPFELVYRRHCDEVFGFLRKRLPERDAADAFQDTFLRALRAYPRLSHGEGLRAWLFTVARSVLADRARRASSRPHELSTADIDAAASAAPAHGPGGGDPGSLLAERSGLGALTAELPARERAVVVLRYGLDLSYEEIAATLDSSSDATRQAASSGVRRLRRTLETSGRNDERDRDDAGTS